METNIQEFYSTQILLYYSMRLLNQSPVFCGAGPEFHESLCKYPLLGSCCFHLSPWLEGSVFSVSVGWRVTENSSLVAWC